MKNLLEKALDQEPLKLAKAEGTIVAAGGVVRINRLVAKSGGTEIISDAALDLAKFNLDASIGFQNPAPKGTNIKPAVTVAWRGPLADPERRLEVAPLMAVISLRAMDSEMQKIRDRATAAGSPQIPMLATEAPAPAPAPKAKTPPRPKPQQRRPRSGGRCKSIHPSNALTCVTSPRLTARASHTALPISRSLRHLRDLTPNPALYNSPCGKRGANMLAFLGLVITTVSGGAFWYLLPKNGEVHRLVTLPGLDQLLPVSLVSGLAIEITMLISGFTS